MFALSVRGSYQDIHLQRHCPFVPYSSTSPDCGRHCCWCCSFLSRLRPGNESERRTLQPPLKNLQDLLMWRHLETENPRNSLRGRQHLGSATKLKQSSSRTIFAKYLFGKIIFTFPTRPMVDCLLLIEVLITTTFYLKSA